MVSAWYFRMQKWADLSSTGQKTKFRLVPSRCSCPVFLLLYPFRCKIPLFCNCISRHFWSVQPKIYFAFFMFLICVVVMTSNIQSFNRKFRILGLIKAEFVCHVQNNKILQGKVNKRRRTRKEYLDGSGQTLSRLNLGSSR